MRAPRLSHPVMLVALATLIVNDHVLKSAFHSWVTGKLSDVAGMILFPVFVGTLAAPLWRDARARLRVATIATMLVFAWTKVDPAGTAFYREALALLQWPLHALAAGMRGRALPALARVVAVTDPTDLIALPFALTGLVLAAEPTRLAVSDRRRVLALARR